jgi:HEAT repeat protein
VADDEFDERNRAVKTAAVGLFLALLAAGTGLFVVWRKTPHSPQAALAQFQSQSEYEVAEEELMDPLLLAGADVVPLLISEVQKREMPRRRYAIAALGHIGDPRAITVLEQIASDRTETDYIRCDALEATARIDRETSQRLAASIRTDGICAREVSLVVSKKAMPRRTLARIILGDFYDVLVQH